ncbi:PAS domain-containing protein [Methylobacterium radiodurans]|uniref:histidine kinase n=1 Tax=Methylobacterium radiodurans TaxID=2202828 RepID=A0A2U8VT62_9HYPH|nr:PAS domain-containing protein [Methylobacterium radiodurans]AWN36895.1 histidine kinase [Methylobacterium radiodurans]
MQPDRAITPQEDTPAVLAGLSPGQVLRMVEGFGLTGTWSWSFATGAHVWSPGLFRILGLEPDRARAEYGLLLALVHPDDRAGVTSASEMLQTGRVAQATFRVVRPDGTLGTVMSRGEVIVAPDGRPRRAMGVLIDVSDREALARASEVDRRRRRAIFEQVGAFTSSSRVYPYTDFSAEWLELVGLPKAELLGEPTLPVLKEERARWRDHGRALYLSKQVVHTQPRLVLAGGAIVPYRFVMVPMRDTSGAIESWTNYVAPLALAGGGSVLASMPGSMTAPVQEGLDQFLAGAHLRAGRALLGWSMQQLAGASGLSFSTVRRLEDGESGASGRARSAAAAALRRHGIVFTLTNDGAIALSRR